MKSVAPFGDAGEGRFLTGNIHCHTDQSDGLETVEGVISSYRDAGHDFICITDHYEAKFGWKITDASRYSSPDFVVIPGTELSSADWIEPDCYWINAIGLDPSFSPPHPGESKLETIARAHRAGAFMVLLHPGLNNLGLEKAGTIEHVHAVEIENTSMRLTFPDATSGIYILDGLLKLGRKVNIATGDDAHGFHKWDRFENLTRVRAKHLDDGSIVAALKAGHFYSSQGPEIRNIKIGSGQIEIDAPGMRAIAISGMNWLDTKSVQGDPVDNAKFSLDAFADSYVRITIVDAAGKRAWSNPIYLSGKSTT